MASLFPEPAAPGQSSAQWINAHCDGGARGNPGPAGYGAVVTDDAGHTLAELSEYLGHRTNNFAEYSGLLGVLQWAIDHQYPNLRVVSDSELMVKQIQGKYKVNSPDLRPLWEEARRRIAQLDGFQISHALRHKNKAADALANEAMDRGSGRPAAGRPAAGRPAAGRPSPTSKSAATTSTQNPGAPHSPMGSSSERVASQEVRPKPSTPAMLRGFTRDGSIHLLGGASLPDGIFVKVIPE
jgi:probable phosphoglycerate mutase